MQQGAEVNWGSHSLIRRLFVRWQFISFVPFTSCYLSTKLIQPARLQAQVHSTGIDVSLRKQEEVGNES